MKKWYKVEYPGPVVRPRYYYEDSPYSAEIAAMNSTGWFGIWTARECDPGEVDHILRGLKEATIEQLHAELKSRGFKVTLS